MTRIKTIYKNVELLDIKKVKSKKNNEYQVLTVKDETSQEVQLYDPNNYELEINKFYDFDLEVIISSYPNIKVLNYHQLNDKKGFFK